MASEATYELAATRDRAGGPERILGFGAPGPELRTLLDRSSLFCVIANPGPLGAPSEAPDPARPSFAGRLWIADWLAEVAPGASVLILKYCGGTLRDLVAAPEAWAAPKTFSTSGPGGDVRAVQARVQARVEDGLARAAAGDPLYDVFAQIAQDPRWTGFLVLHAQVGAAGLPRPLASLASDPRLGAMAFRYLWSRARDPRPAILSGVIDHSADGAAEAEAAAGLSLRRLRTRIDYNYRTAFSAEAALSFGGAAPPLLLSVGASPDSVYTFAPESGREVYRLDCDSDPPQRLEGWLKRLLAGLRAFEAEDPVTLGLSIAYQSTAGGGLPVSVPVTRLAGIPLAETAADDLAEGLGGAIAAWFEAQRPAAQGSLLFDASLASGRPDLAITLPPISLDLARLEPRPGR